MKPEFSEILLPPVRLSQGSNSYNGNDNNSSSSTKWFAISAIVFALAVTIITTTVIVRYEDRFSVYEQRIAAIEEELDEFYKKFLGEGLPDYLEDPIHLDDEDEEKELFGEIHLEDPNNRSKRQIPISNEQRFGPNVPRTNQGVPILEDSYLDRVSSPSSSSQSRTFGQFQSQPPTTESEGLRLYEGLVITGGRNEPKSLDFSSNPELNPIQPHHRTSAAWSEKTSNSGGLQLRSGDSLTSGPTGPSFSDNIFYSRSSSRSSSSRGAGSSAGYNSALYGNNYSPLTSTVHRGSRVPSTGDYLYPQNTRTRSYQYPPLKKLGQGDGEVVARVVQSENEAEVDQVTATANQGETATSHAESTRRKHSGYRRHNPLASTGGANPGRRTRFQNRKNDDSDEISIVRAEAWVDGPARTVAAHYVADVSNYTTSHRHYEGNGRLRNSDGIFASWKPSDWMAGTEMSKAFSLSAHGVLTVKNPGLYYIYAQIHYLDDHDINGYVVQVNTEPFLQCTTMTETQGGGSKSNSCFTAGVTLLNENDRLIVKDIETNRYSIFKPEKSFFGLMRIGDSVRRTH